MPEIHPPQRVYVSAAAGYGVSQRLVVSVAALDTEA